MADVPLLGGPCHSISKPVSHVSTRQEPPARAWSLHPGTEAPLFSLPTQICRFPWLLHRSGSGVSVVNTDGLPSSSTALLLTEASWSVSWTVENPQEPLFQGLLGKPQQARAWHTGISGQDAVFFSGASGGEHVVVWKTLQSPRRVTSVVAK